VENAFKASCTNSGADDRTCRLPLAIQLRHRNHSKPAGDKCFKKRSDNFLHAACDELPRNPTAGIAAAARTAASGHAAVTTVMKSRHLIAALQTGANLLFDMT